MENLGRQREIKLVMVISFMQGPMDTVILGFDNGFPSFPVKVPPILLLGLTKTGSLTLSLKE